MAWCTIESDPGVFTELIAQIGVSNVGVQEIYSLDSLIEELDMSYDDSDVSTVPTSFFRAENQFGLIFLYKWRKEHDQRTVLHYHDGEFNTAMLDNEIINDEVVQQLFYAKQVVQDACATQAILSILLNLPEGSTNSVYDVNIGERLRELKGFCSALDAESNGMLIGSSDFIKEAHNSFARAEPFIREENKSSKGKGEAFHFVAYLPFNGYVFELDGLLGGPVAVARYGTSGAVRDSWLHAIRPVVSDRIARYCATSNEQTFALLSVGKSQSSLLQERLSLISTQLALAVSMSDESAIQKLTAAQKSVEDLIVEDNNVKRSQVRENERRRHNMVPLGLELLKILAEEKCLVNGQNKSWLEVFQTRK